MNRAPEGKAAPYTILVHGFTRTRFDMALMAKRLKTLLPESSIHTFGYRSRRHTMEEVAQQLAHFVDSTTQGAPVSFVAHSLGGLVVRALDAFETPTSPLCRLVTLGSPHQGASVARFFSRLNFARAIGGPVLAQLATPPLPSQPRTIAVGCLIGTTGTPLGFLPFLGGDNDGLVTKRDAEFPAATHSREVAILHPLFPFSGRATRFAAHYLRHGNFDLASESA